MQVKLSSNTARSGHFYPYASDVHLPPKRLPTCAIMRRQVWNCCKSSIALKEVVGGGLLGAALDWTSARRNA